MLARLGNVFVCFVLLCILSPRVCWADEPESCSRLCYEEKILEKVIRIEMKLEEIERQMQEGKGEQKVIIPKVAFRVMPSKDIGQVTRGQVIEFDQINLNLGNAYGTRPGYFKAPYNGTYLFSMTLGNPGVKEGGFFLVHNGKVIEFIFTGYNSGWAMGGATTVAELLVGDEVWVEGEGYITGSYERRIHTSFSGVLLHVTY